MRFLESDEADDPILSVVNLVDLFLVVIAVLMAMNINNPLNQDNVMIIENPGEADMTITIKDGETLTRYESTSEIGEGTGVVAGQTYQLDDGRLIYVPAEGVNP
ncbi:DUF2149 domain-containing protein [Ferrimonas marina]|uniref:DUF2149 domain-containing protein n=1 Tax=Ferrimonas marina TaxID=299255 RepID=A0A1M5MTG4_9GAMM|nr:DUF2149 domain-containing protein [Ferrimonas marina]SHG80485.1 hypothetical protein SAMN02745129_0769 [Ferrimonas marina]